MTTHEAINGTTSAEKGTVAVPEKLVLPMIKPHQVGGGSDRHRPEKAAGKMVG